MTREEKIWELVDKYWKEDEISKSDLFDFAEEILALDDWISVEDNPPEMDKNYIVSDGKGFVGEMKYSSNKYSKKPKPRFEWQGRVNFPWEIKYYIPLPTLPKGE